MPPPSGIGDDAALLRAGRTGPAGRGTQRLISTDSLIETRHFSRDEPAYLLGRKSLAVNMSDIAAMGGTPTSFLLTLGIPADLPSRYLDDYLAGLAASAREHGLNLIGGDTSSSPGPFVISITIIGRTAKAPKPRILTRSGSRPGDLIYVSGPLGGSAAGRALLSAGYRPRLDPARRVLRRVASPAGAPPLAGVRALEAMRLHLDPRPRIALGLRLAGLGIASAAIDLSDGLSLDLARLAEASGVGASLLSHAIPIADCARAVSSALALNPQSLALDGGEDYELLFTVPAHKEPRLFDQSVFFIGRVAPRRAGLCLVDAAGNRSRLRPGGFDHFRSVNRLR